MKSNWIITIVIAVVVAGAAFFGGMQYQKMHIAGSSATGGQYGQGGQGANGRFGGARRAGAGGATVGQVVSQDANSITVQLADGSSKIVNISGTTTFSKTASASKSDIQTGTRIAAFGTPNSDGSISAQNVQINPMIRTGRGTGIGG